jgi:hypothetical protein
MDVTIPVSATRCARALAAAVAMVTGASICASVLSFVVIRDPVLSHVRDTFVRLTWVDGEANIPAWFSAVLLLLAALLLAAIASAERRDGGQAALWSLLAAIFVLLSLDEVAQLHELSIRPLRDHFHATGFLYYTWIVPAGLAASAAAVGYSGFLFSLPRRSRRLFLVSGALYVGGALVVEALSGRQASLYGEQSLGYHLIVTVEELLEMTGVVVFIYALLDHISRRFSRLSFLLPPQ